MLMPAGAPGPSLSVPQNTLLLPLAGATVRHAVPEPLLITAVCVDQELRSDTVGLWPARSKTPLLSRVTAGLPPSAPPDPASSVPPLTSTAARLFIPLKARPPPPVLVSSAVPLNGELIVTCPATFDRRAAVGQLERVALHRVVAGLEDHLLGLDRPEAVGDLHVTQTPGEHGRGIGNGAPRDILAGRRIVPAEQAAIVAPDAAAAQVRTQAAARVPLDDAAQQLPRRQLFDAEQPLRVDQLGLAGRRALRCACPLVGVSTREQAGERPSAGTHGSAFRRLNRELRYRVSAGCRDVRVCGRRGPSIRDANTIPVWSDECIELILSVGTRLERLHSPPCRMIIMSTKKNPQVKLICRLIAWPAKKAFFP